MKIASLMGCAVVGLGACGAPVPPVRHALTPCELRWPAPPAEQTMREGRYATGTVAFVEHAGVRYEGARFVRDEALSPRAREKLLGAVERGLQARPGVSAAERVGDVLVLSLVGGGRGRFRVFFVDAHTLVELSVVGDDASGVDEAARWFFAGARCPTVP